MSFGTQCYRGFRASDCVVRYGLRGEVPVDGHAYHGLSDFYSSIHKHTVISSLWATNSLLTYSEGTVYFRIKRSYHAPNVNHY